jgi:tetratricopeptide (TPR) repeat protein
MSIASRRYYLRGRRSLELGEADQAIESLASAIDLAPHFIDARLAYAVALCRVGDVPRASQTLRAGLGHARTEPARAALWLSLGEVLTMGGDFLGAEDAFNQAALAPAYASRAAAGRGRVYAKSGRAGDAIASFLRAVGRGVTTAVVIVVALGLPATACKSDDKPATTAPAPTSTPTPVKPVEKAPVADPAAGEPPSSVTPERKALAEKVLAHMEAIATAGDTNQADCKRAAAAMKAEMDKAKTAIAEMDKMKNEAPDQAARQWFEKAYGIRMTSVMGKVIGVANKCKADPDFQAAMANSPFTKKTPDAPAPAAPAHGAPTPAAPAPAAAPTPAAPAPAAAPTPTAPAPAAPAPAAAPASKP